MKRVQKVIRNRAMRKNSCRTDEYLALVRDWKLIVDREESVAVRQEACLALLQRWVQNIATARIGQVDASLRFYADMLCVKSFLAPHSTRDELGYLDIHPGYRLVSNWLRDNADAGRSRKFNCDLKIEQYMNWQQLRAIMFGERQWYAALDRDDRYSDYVHSVLARIITYHS